MDFFHNPIFNIIFLVGSHSGHVSIFPRLAVSVGCLASSNSRQLVSKLSFPDKLINKMTQGKENRKTC